MEWSGVEWSGVEWSGVEWSGVEWRVDADPAANFARRSHVLRLKQQTANFPHSTVYSLKK